MQSPWGHYHVAVTDFVTHLDVPGKIKYKDELIILQPHSEANFWDHPFLSPTFSKTIKNHVKLYLQEHVENK